MKFSPPRCRSRFLSLAFTIVVCAIFLTALRGAALADPPQVIASTAALGINATTITIQGRGFDATAASNSVVFNDGAIGTVTGATPFALTITFATNPAACGALTAVVTTDGVSSGAPVPVATVVPVAQFTADSETVSALAGGFSIPVSVSANPVLSNHVTPTDSLFATGFTLPSGLAFDAGGNLYVSDTTLGTVSKVTQAGVISIFASGFHFPGTLAFDAAGNLYVANYDANQNGIVSVVSPAGVVSPFAAGFTAPSALAFDSTGNLYVADNTTGTVSQVTPGGVVSPFASGFHNPVALVFDAAGYLYVATSNDFSVWKVPPQGSGELTTSFASGLPVPTAMTIDSVGNLYVAGHPTGFGFPNNGVITMLTPDRSQSTVISNYPLPSGMAIDAAGNLYAALPNTLTLNAKHGVDKLTPTALVPFTVSGSAGFNVDYGGLTTSPLKLLNGQPTAAITGTLNANPGITPTLIINFGTPNGAVLGSPSTNTLTISEPPPSVTASTANLPIDATSIMIQGVFSPVAGNDTVTFNDGAAGTVVVASSTSITVQFTTPPASLGVLTASVTCNGLSTGAPVPVATVVPDVTSGSSAQALTANTLIITGAGFDPVAANNTVTFSNGAVGTVTAATSTQLTITFTTLPATTGALTAVITTDGVSTAPVQVAVVEPTAQFTVGSETVDATTGAYSIPVTLTGNPTFASDGVTGTGHTFVSSFSSTGYVAFDAAGNLYVSDTTAGTVSKVAPDGTAAVFVSSLASPTGLAFDSLGNLYVASLTGNTVSKVTSAGVVSPFASGLNGPVGLAVDAADNIYVANTGTNSVCKVTPGGVVSTFVTGIIAPGGLALDPSGNLFVANQTGGTVYKFTPTGTPIFIVTAGGIFGGTVSGVACDSAGNGYVSYSPVGITILSAAATIGSGAGVIIIGGGGPPLGGVNRISPDGTVSVFLGGILKPNGLAFDHAGNLYVSKSDTIASAEVQEYLPTVLVPFLIDGTAINGTDYTSNTQSPLSFVNGQSTVNITGALYPNAGATPTLTYTLDTPTGAVLGSPAVNTLTINEAAPAVTASTAGLPINAESIILAGNFSPLPENDSVTFNNGAAGIVSAATATSITVTFSSPPASLGALTAVVTCNGVSSGAPVIVATVVPGVVATGSAVALDADTLIITGAGFDPVAAQNTVVFSNGAVGTVIAATATQLTVSLSHLPNGVGNIYAIVTSDGFTNTTPVAVATVEPAVRFTAGSENVNALDGTFSIPVTLDAPPTFDSGVAPVVAPFASGLSYSFAYQTTIAFDAAGNLFVACPGDGTVRKVTPAGAASIFFTGLINPAILAFDPAGNLWVGDNGNGSISEISPAGVITPVLSDLSFIAGMTFDPQGNLYYSHYDENAVGLVTKVAPGGATSTYASGFQGVQNIAFDKAGNLYVLDQPQAAVHKVAPNGTVSLFANPTTYLSGLAIDAAGNLYVSSYDQGLVVRITPGGAVATLVNGLSYPQGLALDAAGNLYVANIAAGDGKVSKVLPTAQVAFALGGSALAGTDYSGLVDSPLTFVNGQTTAYITGTLLADPGATPTLTFTLQPPSGAVLGSPSVNAMSINEPAPSVTSSTASLSINATTLVIQGLFNPVAANNTVIFNNGAVGTVTFASVNTLVVTLTTPPSGLGVLTATVTSNGLGTGAPVAVATIVPGVTLHTAPVSLAVATVTINGFGFDPTPANNTVAFSSGAVGTVTAASPTQLTVQLSTPPQVTGGLTAVVTTRGLSSPGPVAVAVVEPIAQFSATAESADAIGGSFSVAVTLTGNPTLAAAVGLQSSTIATGLQTPLSVAIDSTGNIFACDYDLGTITKITAAGASSTFASGLTKPMSVAVDAAGTLFVGCNTLDPSTPGTTGSIYKISTTGQVSLYADGLLRPSSMAFDPAGNLYVVNYYPGNFCAVYRFTPGGQVSAYLTGVFEPGAITFDAGGNFYIAFIDANSRIAHIDRIQPDGEIVVINSGIDFVSGLAVDNVGNLYINDGTLKQLAPDGTVRTLSSELYFASGLALGATGDLYVAELDASNNNQGIVAQLAPTVQAPFTLGGTAAAGTDYTGVTASPVTFANGQPAVTITGTLIPDPGATPALTFTLGTPNGAFAGTPLTNTLTIVEPPPSVTTSTASLGISATTLVINGIFNPVAANNTVTFNNGAVGTVTNATAYSLTVQLTTLPTTVGNLTATIVSAGLSTGAPVTVATIVPVITPALPLLSLNAPTLTIHGFGFDPVAEHNTVTLSDGAAGTVTAATANQLTVTFTSPPTGTGILLATVTTDGFGSGTPVEVAALGPVVQFAYPNQDAYVGTHGFDVSVILAGNPTFASGAVPTVSTFASNFMQPSGMAFDSAGNLFVTNYESNSISKVAPNGTVSTFATGLYLPMAIAIDAADNVYVNTLFTTVRKFTPDGVGSDFLTDLQNEPAGLAFDAAGNLYVACQYGNSIIKATPDGTMTTFASGFSYPNALAFDPAGNLYVLSYNYLGGGNNNGIVSKVTPAGQVSVIATGFQYPDGLTCDTAGNVYVADGTAQTISQITPSGAASVLTLNTVSSPSGLAFDTAGNLYAGNGQFGVSKIAPTVLVPFTIGGTAEAGSDYSDVTAGPLRIVNGVPYADITGSLYVRPGASPTLTFTLGTPTGASLGTPIVNTVSIHEAPTVLSNVTYYSGTTTTVLIGGFGFDPTALNNTVTFNNGAIGSVVGVEGNQLIVQLTHGPSSLGLMTAVVTTDGQSSGAPINIGNVSSITSVTGISYSAGGAVTLNFSGTPNTTYGLQYRSSLTAPTWSNVAPITTDNSGAVQYTHTPPAGDLGFYRLVYPAP